jgi:hypothetical protein
VTDFKLRNNLKLILVWTRLQVWFPLLILRTLKVSKLTASFLIGMGRAQARARPGLSFGLSPQLWIISSLSKSPSSSPILLYNHPGPENP